MDYIIDYKREVTSTNTLCMELGKNTNTNHYALVAEKQTAGRGRLGRDWHSEEGAGLYMSILERPGQELMQKIAPVTLIVALALREALFERTGMDCQIKWPNDLVYNGKKIAGILTQAHGMPQPEFFVTGIGLNVFHETFPEELKEKATSLYLEKFCEKYDTDLKKRLIESIIKNWKKYYNEFIQTGFAPLKETYNSHLSGCGKQVVVHDPEGEYEATLVGVNEAGELMVKKDGDIRLINSGEVSVRGVNGYV